MKRRRATGRMDRWRTSTQGRAWIETRLKARAAGTLIDWIAFEDNAVIGIAFLSALSIENLRGEVGYAVHRERRGKGYGTELIECVLTYAISTLVCTASRPMSTPATPPRSACWNARAS